MISLIQLEYIVAVDTYRHFVTASEKCFVTQPTLSMQIKKMEEEIGVVIFDRSKQPIIPTEVGEKIIAQARKILRESKKIQEIVDIHDQTIQGELTIGVIPTLAPYLLPRFIGAFTTNYPEVKLIIKELLTEKVVDQLQKDLIDVGIVVTPLHEKGVEETPLFYEEMMVYAHKDSSFATQEEVDPAALGSEGLWLLNAGHCFRSQVLNLCMMNEKKQKERSFNYESGSLETIKKLVETEGGFTLIPELADDKNSGDVVVKRFISPTPLREVSLVYARTFAKRQLINLLKESIIEAVPANIQDKDRGVIVDWK